MQVYGGVRLSRTALDQIATSLRTGRIPLTVDHDSTAPVTTRNMTAEIVDRDDESLVVVSGEWLISAVDHYSVRHPGWSITIGEPFELSASSGAPPTGRPTITVAADAAWFDDDTIDQAAQRLSFVADARTSRMYQFSVLPDPRVIIDAADLFMRTVGWNVVGSALWSAVEWLYQHKRRRLDADPSPPTIIEIHTATFTAVVKTSDPEVAKAAINRLPELLDQRLPRHSASGSKIAPTYQWTSPPVEAGGDSGGSGHWVAPS